MKKLNQILLAGCMILSMAISGTPVFAEGDNSGNPTPEPTNEIIDDENINENEGVGENEKKETPNDSKTDDESKNDKEKSTENVENKNENPDKKKETPDEKNENQTGTPDENQKDDQNKEKTENTDENAGKTEGEGETEAPLKSRKNGADVSFRNSGPAKNGGGEYVPLISGSEFSHALFTLTHSYMYGNNKDNAQSFERAEEIPEGAETVDISEAQDRSAVMWAVKDNSTNKYDVYWYANGAGLRFNPDSKMMFFNTGVKSLDLADFRVPDGGMETENMFLNASISSIDMTPLGSYRLNGSAKGMFNGARMTDINLGDVDTSAVTDMSDMFNGAVSYYVSNCNLDLSKFNTESVTTMAGMFSNNSSLTDVDLSSFNTSAVTDMSDMFARTGIVEKDLTGLDTSSVVTMARMFKNNSALRSLDTSNWDTSKVEDMSEMFRDCQKLTNVSLSDWNVGSVKSTSGMFRNCEVIPEIDVSKWDVSHVEDMSNMFDCAFKVKSFDVGRWNTQSVKNMNSLFAGCWDLEAVDVSNWNTSNVENMSYTFGNCTKLETIAVQDWDVSKVRVMSGMFNACTKLRHLNLEKWRTSSLQNAERLFAYCESLEAIDITSFDCSGLVNGIMEPTGAGGMFANMRDVQKVVLPATMTGTDGSQFQNAFVVINGSGLRYGYHFKHTKNLDGTSTGDNTVYTDVDIEKLNAEQLAGTWERVYVISYIDAELNEFPDGAITEYTKQSDTFTLNNPVREGYEFVGWTDQKISTPVLEVTIPAGSAGDLEFTANWVLGSHTVTYDVTEKGSGTFADQEKKTGVNLVLHQESPVGNNYINTYTVKFDAEGVNPVEYQKGYKYDFAHWEDADKNQYNPGDTYTDDADLALTAQYNRVGAEQKITLPDAEREGYDLVGWKDPDGSAVGKPGAEWNVPDNWDPENDKLSPEWIRTEFSVSYNAGAHGTADIPAGTKQRDVDYTISDVIPVGNIDLNTFEVKFDAKDVSPVEYQKGVKYTFDHWAGDDEHEYSPAGTFAGNYDLALTAKYSDEPVITSIILPNAEKEGYRFIGWEDPEGNPVGKAGNEWTPYENWNPENDMLVPVFRSETQEVVITIDTYLDDNLYSGNEFRFEVKNENGDVLGTITDLVNGRGSCEITVPSFEDTTVTISQIPGNNVMMNYDMSIVEKTIPHIYE